MYEFHDLLVFIKLITVVYVFVEVANLIISFFSFKLIVIHLSYSFNEVIDGLILVMIDLIIIRFFCFRFCLLKSLNFILLILVWYFIELMISFFVFIALINLIF